MISDLRLSSRRAALTAVITLTLAGVVASPASAHVEVSADGAQAGTGPATLVFSAESESRAAGIVSIRTQLPAGIAPADVTLAGAPAGWALTPTADGFELGGADLGPGTDAQFSVTVARLHVDPTELVFPTLQRYSDGREDAWIEPATAAVPEPANPAPVLTVAPAPPGATAAATATPTSTATAPTTSATEPTTAPATSPAQSDDAAEGTAEDSGLGTPAIVLTVLAVLGLLAAAVWAVRRRRT